MQHPAEQVKKQYTEYKGEEVKYAYHRIVPTKIPGSISRVFRVVQICLLQLAAAHDVRGGDGG